jgi:hypothetical protein
MTWTDDAHRRAARRRTAWRIVGSVLLGLSTFNIVTFLVNDTIGISAVIGLAGLLILYFKRKDDDSS